MKQKMISLFKEFGINIPKKLSWERIKSVLLTVLVTISIVLTWNLWTYQFGLKTLERDEDKYIENVAIDSMGQRSLAEVFQPTNVIFHQNGKSYGMTTSQELKSIYEAVTSAKFDRFGSYNNDSASWENKDEFVKLIFPANIWPGLFQKVLKFTNQDGERFSLNIPFDRIAFYKQTGTETNMIAVFKNKKEQPVATAKVNGLSFSDLMNYKQDDTKLYFREELENGNFVYLPEGRVDMPKLTYSVQWIEKEKFRDALFIGQDVSEQVGYYTDGVHLLELKGDDGQIIKYIDPGSNQDNQVISLDDNIVQQTFDYVNSHSGWTNDYIFSNYNGFETTKRLDKPVVTFRLMMGQGDKAYPVFSPMDEYFYNNFDAATIYVSRQNGMLHEYMRTRLDIREGDVGSKDISLHAGRDFINDINDHEGINPQHIEDITIGYHMAFPSETETGLVTLNPKWFILYNGEWKTLGEFEAKKKEMGQP
jgi:regulatory protein YycH of two-component signal transduction system YycFG